MNYLKNFGLSILLLAGLLFTGCQKDTSVEGTAAYIPATATTVTGFDLQRLIKKADFEKLKDMEFFKEMSAKAGSKSPMLAEAMNDPRKSGIDLNGKVFMTTDLDKNDPERLTTHILVPLSDAGDFEKLLTEAEIAFEASGGLKVAAPKNTSDAALVWNDHLLVVTFTNHDSQNLVENAKKLFKMEEEKTLASNGNFAKAINQDHDMVSWLSTNTLADNPASGMAMTMLDLDKGALKDNFIHSYGDFENGKIVGRSDFFINKSLGKDLLGRFFKDGSETDFSKVLPTDGLAFVMTGAMNFKGMDQFLSERPQTKEYADFVLNDFAGFERKQILETLNGDMMVAGYSSESIQNGDFMVAMALKDNGKAKDMLAKAVADKKLKDTGNGIYEVLELGGGEFSIRRNKGMGKFLHFEDMLVYSPKEEWLEKIGKREIPLGSGNTKTVLKSIGNETMAAWFDFQSLGKAMGDVPQGFFKDMRFQVNSDGADFLLETTDPNKNSLQVLFEMMEQAYLKNNRESI